MALTVYDTDSHLREEYWMDEVYKLEGEFAHLTPKRLNDYKDVRVRFEHSFHPWPDRATNSFSHKTVYDPSSNWNGGEVAARQVGGWDMEARLKNNDAEGIDVQFLFPTQLSIPTYIEGPLGAALCRAFNNWVAKLVKGHEDRLKPIGVMPWGHPEAILGELKYCVNELGFRAIHLTPYTHKLTIDNEVFFPFYEEVQRMDVPLMLHVASFGELINKYDNFFAMHVLGRPFNTTAGLVALVIGGIFERFPKLRVAFFECSAEWILYWMHRMDDDYSRMKSGFAGRVSMAPSEYCKRNCYVTCEADEELLAHAIEHFSEDRILMATDYPHFDSEYPGTRQEIMDRTDITQIQKEKIVSKNAEEFLRLP